VRPLDDPRGTLLAEPGYLPAGECSCLAWFHPASGAGSGLPVLMCPAWGDEAIGAYRGWRDLALALARGGRPVLRLDWPGDGDAFDPPAGQLPLQAWQQALAVAIDALKTRTGSPAVLLLGLRLGALAAAQAAAARPDVAGLMLLQPPSSGRAWLREMRLLAGPADADGLAPGDAWAGGFVWPADAAAALKDWRWPDRSPPTLMLDRADRPWPDAARQGLQQACEALTWQARDDLDDLTSTAHAAQWPPDLAAALLAWAGELAPAGAPAAAVAAPMPWFDSASHGGVCEQAVAYAAERWGVLSLPAAGAAALQPSSGRAVLLLSSGADRRVGPHRLWVPWARARAARGDHVLRIDLAGFGDSGCRGVDNVAEAIYDARCVSEDIGAAIDWLRRQPGVRSVALVGLCSGAHHAWRAAVQRLAVEAVVPINPMVFHWQPGTPLDPARMAFGQIHIAASAGQSLRDPSRWLKLLRGQVNVRVILRALAGRAWQGGRAALRDLARLLHWPLRDDLGSELRQVARRGVQMQFVFAASDPGLALASQEAGRTWARLVRDGRVRLATVDQADHTFSTPAARERLYHQLHACIDGLTSAPAGLAQPRPANDSPS
jgi:pimeloyl-ACP methyl ester carboxylesterase